MEMHEAIRREGLAAGQLVVALKGHDCGRCFLLTKVEGRRVWMVDGKHYFWDKPKLKHVKHVKALRQLSAADFALITDESDINQRNAMTRKWIRAQRLDPTMEDTGCQKKM